MRESSSSSKRSTVSAPGLRAKLKELLSVHEGDEGQGGEHSRVHPDAPGLNARPGQGVHQQAAEGVVPHLAQKGGGGPIAAEGGQKIARRPAGVGGQGGIASPSVLSWVKSINSSPLQLGHTFP